ncbi:MULTISPECIES: hypothetical protein [Nostocales]|uniref:Uncharacterized protein n=3 Tax=Nostocales TaxID=1161 RepID=A0A8S9T6L0_9CYAN|nr:hypothetical protein [Tolypothrix bouteillei]KAF3888201.1 hypothetical protein DA73_0400023945 [Tolypothrix bouteillei VB521301]
MKKALIAASTLFASVEILTLVHLPVMALPKPSVRVSQAVQAPLPPNSTIQSPTPALGFGLADGTPVKVKFKQTISSKTAKENDTVEFEVSENVLVGNAVVIAKGAIAKGIVTRARRSGMLGRKGKLNVALKEVTLVSGERISIRAEQKSGGGTSGGVIAAAAVLTPLALLFKGKNRTYEAGTEVQAFVDGNFALDRNKFKTNLR